MAFSWLSVFVSQIKVLHYSSSQPESHRVIDWIVISCVVVLTSVLFLLCFWCSGFEFVVYTSCTVTVPLFGFPSRNGLPHHFTWAPLSLQSAVCLFLCSCSLYFAPTLLDLIKFLDPGFDPRLPLVTFCLINLSACNIYIWAKHFVSGSGLDRAAACLTCGLLLSEMMHNWFWWMTVEHAIIHTACI